MDQSDVLTVNSIGFKYYDDNQLVVQSLIWSLVSPPGLVCGEEVCAARPLQPSVQPGGGEGRLLPPLVLRALRQPVHRSGEGVPGGAGQAPRSQVRTPVVEAECC